jgi:sugar/nucleoside kinase (ribokinase family)
MRANHEYDAVVAGHVCLDITPRFHDAGARDIAKLLAPGKLINVGNAALSTGGAVSNTGIGMARLGARVALMGKIGNDLFGSGIQAVFKAMGADDALKVAVAEYTSYTVVIAPPGIDRIFLHHPGANDSFRADDVIFELTA